jgi:hypothetical protein
MSRDGIKRKKTGKIVDRNSLNKSINNETRGTRMSDDPEAPQHRSIVTDGNYILILNYEHHVLPVAFTLER